MRRILVAAAVVVLASLVSVASPAQAASGPWSVVSGGSFHTCAINAGKSLYCWGANSSGQVGDGTVEQRTSPKKIGASGAWATVSAGGFHTCAISTGKSLYCWGFNGNGQSGDGTVEQRISPKKIGTSGAWATVSVGHLHTCAVTIGDSLYCWGANDSGQIGDGTTDPRVSPRKIGAGGAWAGVTAGGRHTCGITSGDSLYCWGSNLNGEVGDGSAVHPQLSLSKVGSTGVWALADAGDLHTCAISTGKSLYCWGDNNSGAIGDGTAGPGYDRYSPKKIGTSGAWARVGTGGALGYSHTCAVTTGKSLYCWGNDFYDQIGDGTSNLSLFSPKKIGSSGVWAGSTAGGLHACAVSTGNSLYCWGDNSGGQIGDGTTDPRPSPKKVP